jgi:WD40 repeat protein
MSSGSSVLHQTLKQGSDIRCINIFDSGFISSVHHGKVSRWTFSSEDNQFVFSKFSNFKFCCFDLDKSFAISSDGRVCFGMNDEHKTRILVEDLEQEGKQEELLGHFDIITALVYDSEKKKLFSTGKDKSLIKWDLEKLFQEKSEGSESVFLEKQHSNLHLGDIFTLESTSDYRYLMSGGKDKEVKLVEAQELTVIACFDTKMAIYGIVERMGMIYFYGKNAKSIGRWDVTENVREKLPESPKIETKKKKLALTMKSCAFGSEDVQIDKFFNKSTSVNNSKLVYFL